MASRSTTARRWPPECASQFSGWVHSLQLPFLLLYFCFSWFSFISLFISLLRFVFFGYDFSVLSSSRSPSATRASTPLAWQWFRGLIRDLTSRSSLLTAPTSHFAGTVLSRRSKSWIQSAPLASWPRTTRLALAFGFSYLILHLPECVIFCFLSRCCASMDSLLSF